MELTRKNCHTVIDDDVFVALEKFLDKKEESFYASRSHLFSRGGKMVRLRIISS